MFARRRARPATLSAANSAGQPDALPDRGLELTMEERYVWVTTRRLKPGTLEDFVQAWRPEQHPDGIVRAFAYWSEDGREVSGVSYWESKDSCDRWRASEAEAHRRQAMEPFIEDESEAFFRGRELKIP